METGKNILPIIASILTSVLLLTALFLFVIHAPTRAASITINSITTRQNAGVELSPGYSQEAQPGTTVTYFHTLTNTRETTDIFTLEATSSEAWPIELLGGDYPNGTTSLPLQLGAGLTDTIVVSLTVPVDAPDGIIDHTVVTATSQVSSTIRAVITDTTIVRQVVYVELSPGYSQVAKPGAIVTYSHVITNTGITTDTFALEVTSSEAWSAELLGGDYPNGTALLPLQLGAGLTDTIVVSLTVPADAPDGIIDHTVVTATSQTNSNIWTTVTDATIVMGTQYIYLPLVMRDYPPPPPPWQQANGIGGIKVYDIAVCPSDPILQYAGTSSGLYRSTDGGATWQHWARDSRTTPVVVNPLYCNETFVAVWGAGIYRVVGQDQDLPISQGLDELVNVYGLTITADGQTLYAGTNDHGIYKTNTTNVNWIAINSGISDLRIRSLYIISDTMYAGGRQCTYYYSDAGNSWHPQTIVSGGQGGACEDAQVWSIVQMDTVLYAGLGGNKGVYRSDDGGTSWLHISDVPQVTILRFGLHPYQSHLYVGTAGQGVYICELDDHCYLLPNSGLGTPYIRGLAVAETPDARLLAGSDDGIWWVPLTP